MDLPTYHGAARYRQAPPAAIADLAISLSPGGASFASSGASLWAPRWDGVTGGVIAFLATGTVSNRTSSYKPSSSGTTTGGGTINACLTGPSGTDFDLYLQKLSGSTWTDVAKSESASSTETIAYAAGAGTYRVEVYAYSGSGSYTLRYDIP